MTRMSEGFDIDAFRGKDGKKSGRCAVVAVYEDHGNRQLLLQLSDSLSRKFKGALDFQFDWCRFKYLADPEIAMEAADKASRADLILLAPKSPELPVFVQGWFEDWLLHREADNGALVLVEPSPKRSERLTPLQSYLRMAAKRGSLDYVQLDSPELLDRAKPAPELPAAPLQMDQLSQDNPPLHWGINE